MRISDWSSDVCSSDLLSRAQKDASAAINPEYGFDLGVRAGYLVTDKTLVYARGGYENIRTRVQILDLEGPRRGKDNLDGWSVGGGIERAVPDHISARVEYRYRDLGSGGTTLERSDTRPAGTEEVRTWRSPWWA